MKRTYLAAAIFMAYSSFAFADESMRCGNALISSANSVAELLAKCGEPNAKETRTEDVRAQGVHGSFSVGSTVIETWTYQKSSRALPRIVTIVDGKIESIKTKL